MADDRNKVLYGLQYLRFVAAFLVVLKHCWQLSKNSGGHTYGYPFTGGAIGVDVFFVISGFIMVYITASKPPAAGRFLLDRVTRVAPSYWFITLLIAGIMLAKPDAFRSTTLDALGLLTSLAFIPWPSSAVDGAGPLLSVGWTLNYEFLFYGIFASSMLIAPTRRIPFTSAVLALLVLAGFMIDRDANIWAEFFTSTLLVEFVFGMAIAAIYQRLPPHPKAAGVFLLIAVAIFAIALTFMMGRGHPERALIWGVPSALLVMGVIWFDSLRVVPRLRWLLLLGNASYSLYLTHLMVLGAIRMAWPRLPAAVREVDHLLMIVAVLAALAGGIAFYLLVETPLVKLARKLAGQDSGGPAALRAAEPHIKA